MSRAAAVPRRVFPPGADGGFSGAEHRSRIFAGFAVSLSLLVSGLEARILRVPRDYETIKGAVAAAVDGDVVEVDNGFYFEKNIILDKRIGVRAKNLFGAVISGSEEPGTAVFIVRAEVEIAGFIIKNSFLGILQRDSPDVAWTGRDLAFFNMDCAVAVNDREKNIGLVRLKNVFVDNCKAAFNCNDARGMEIERCFISDSVRAFNGSNHLRFIVDRAVLWNCAIVSEEEKRVFPAPATSRIELGPNIHIFRSADPPVRRRELTRQLNILFGEDVRPSGPRNDQPRRREALVLTALGESSLQTRDWSAAASHFRSASAAAVETGLDEIRWRADYGLALAAEGAKDRTAAIDYFKKTVSVIERIGIGLPLGVFQSGFRKDKINVYEKLIHHLMDEHGRAPAAGFDREAYFFAERSKARGLLSGLPLTAGHPAAVSDPGLKKEEFRLARAVTRFQTQLQKAALSAEKRAEILYRLDEAEGARRDFLLRMRRKEAVGKPPGPIGPYRIDAVQMKLLDPSTALIEYMISEEFSCVFLVTRDGLEVASLPPEKEIKLRTANYIKFLTLRGSDDFKGWAGGARLRRMLLGPFEERLSRGIKNLIIVPDGVLYYLPFEALVREDAAAAAKARPLTPRFLVEDFSVGYGASASCLIDLRARPVPGRAAMEFLGVANPYPVKAFGLSTGEERMYPALPFVRREIRTIRDLFPAGRSTVLLGRDAQERNLLALRLTDYRILHFAAHGFFDDQNWWRSSLFLLGDEDDEQDGFFQPADIDPLRLNAELAVLSGCETGNGLLEKGEGLTGLSQAFLRAGARAVLLSLWSVNDKTTQAFMELFYGHLTSGRTAIEALRLTKLDLLRTKNHHPRTWAAFILLGNY